MKATTLEPMTETNDNLIAEFASEIVETSVELNEILDTGEINYSFRAHYVDAENEICGIEQMIRTILDTFDAKNPVGAENTALRAIAIGNSVYVDEVEKMVRATFGEHRYPVGTIKSYLSKKMKDVCKIQLTSAEDSERKCCRPRVKYYIGE